MMIMRSDQPETWLILLGIVIYSVIGGVILGGCIAQRISESVVSEAEQITRKAAR